MAIKATNKLRNLHELGCGCDDECLSCTVPPKVRAIADEIDREVAEKHEACPLDRDGNPIHIDDYVEFSFHGEAGRFKVVGFVKDYGELYVIRDFSGWFCHPSNCRVVKEPPTLKDLVADAVAQCAHVEDWSAEHADICFDAAEFDHWFDEHSHLIEGALK